MDLFGNKIAPTNSPGIPVISGAQFEPDSFSSPQATLIVGPTKKRLTAHSSVLCKWPYFKAALLGGFSEAKSQCIDLPLDSPDTVQALLEFCYSGDYAYHSIKLHSSDEGQALAKMEFHAQIYILADKLRVCDLQSLAADRVYPQVSSASSKDKIRVARYIYQNTPPTDKLLRKKALEITMGILSTPNTIIQPSLAHGSANLGTVAKDPIADGVLEELIAEDPAFALDIIKRFIAR